MKNYQMRYLIIIISINNVIKIRIDVKINIIII